MWFAGLRVLSWGVHQWTDFLLDVPLFASLNFAENWSASSSTLSAFASTIREDAKSLIIKLESFDRRRRVRTPE